jgi:hypothetical protein
VENAACVHQKAFARAGQRYASTIAVQQPQAQFRLECADLTAYGRLGQSDHRRGAAEAARLSDVDEEFDLPQVHAGFRYNYSLYLLLAVL